MTGLQLILFGFEATACTATPAHMQLQMGSHPACILVEVGMLSAKLDNGVGVKEAEHIACSRQIVQTEKQQRLKRLRQAGDPATIRLQHAGCLRPTSTEQRDSPDVRAKKRRVLCQKDQHR